MAGKRRRRKTLWETKSMENTGRMGGREGERETLVGRAKWER